MVKVALVSAKFADTVLVYVVEVTGSTYHVVISMRGEFNYDVTVSSVRLFPGVVLHCRGIEEFRSHVGELLPQVRGIWSQII